MMYMALLNFLNFVLRIESNAELRKKRWDTQAKKDAIEGIKKRTKFMYVYQAMKEKYEAMRQIEDCY